MLAWWLLHRWWFVSGDYHLLVTQACDVLRFRAHRMPRYEEVLKVYHDLSQDLHITNP